MAWTTPFTAVAGNVYTAAQHNTTTRDNLLQTAPALVTAAGQILVSTAANALAPRTPVGAIYNGAVETTTTTTYTDLPTVGPAVTCTTGTQAIVAVISSCFNSGTQACFTGYAVSGASTIAGTDLNASEVISAQAQTAMGVFLQTGLTAGSNTFTMKYRASSGTASFQNRHIWVIPL